MSTGSQVDFSDFFNPVQLFRKLTDKTLELMGQWVSKQIDSRLQHQFKQLEGKLSLEQNLSEAISYIQAGQYEKGRELLITGVLKFEKDNNVALFAMGFALINLGEHERGLEHFEVVFEKSTANELKGQTYFYTALKAYAAGLLKYQKYQRTVLICERFNQIRPDEFEVWDIKARALKELQRYEEAIACHQKALQLNPNHEISRQGLKECHALLQPAKEPFYLPKIDLTGVEIPKTSPPRVETFEPTKTRPPQSPPKVTKTIDVVVRPPKEPPKVPKGSKESIYSSEQAHRRLPQEPPKVDPKYEREYTGKQINEGNQQYNNPRAAD